MSKKDTAGVPLWRCKNPDCVLGEPGKPGLFTSDEDDPTCPVCNENNVERLSEPHVSVQGQDPYEDAHIETAVAILRKQIDPNKAQEHFLRLVGENADTANSLEQNQAVS